MNSIPIQIIRSIALIILLLLTGCNNEHTQEKQAPPDSQSHDLASIKAQLSSSDKQWLTSLKERVQLSNQVANELDILITEYQKEDALEDAIDAMNTAREEALSILTSIQHEFNDQNPAQKQLTAELELSLFHYAEGLRMQLEGIQDGDSEKLKTAFTEIAKAKETLAQLLSVIDSLLNSI